MVHQLSRTFELLFKSTICPVYSVAEVCLLIKTQDMTDRSFILLLFNVGPFTVCTCVWALDFRGLEFYTE